MMQVRGSGVIEKDKRYKNTWKITCYLGEKDEKGRYKRAPKRTIHGTKEDARKAVAEYKAELQGTAPEGPGDMRIGDYARQFHEQREGTLASPLSYKREALDIRYIDEMFGNIKIKDLTPGMIRSIYAKARKQKKHSENALHKTHQKLRQVMQAAYMDEIIMRNPCDLVKFPRPKPAEERSSLTPEETARLYKCAFEEGGSHAIGLMLMITTGMRRGEMLGLTWKYIDFETSQLFVANQYDVSKTLRPPKTSQSRRWICFKGHMAEVLAEWNSTQADELAALGIKQSDSTPVFQNSEGDFIDPNNYSRWWRCFSVDNGFGKFTRDVRTIEVDGVMRQRGKGYEGLKLHELRNTQATLIQAKVNPKAAQHRLGHTQMSLTMDVYAKSLDSDEIASAEAMDDILRPDEN
jgi:integrase